MARGAGPASRRTHIRASHTSGGVGGSSPCRTARGPRAGPGGPETGPRTAARPDQRTAATNSFGGAWVLRYIYRKTNRCQLHSSEDARMTDPAGFTLVSHTLGGLPLVNHVLRRLRFDALLHRQLPPPDPRAQLPPALALGVLTRNLVLARVPLYGLGEWARGWVPALLGLRPEHVGLLNDDRVGRALD